MVPAEEENFPRGGRKINQSLKRPKQDDNLFSIAKPPKPKKTRKSHKETVAHSEDTFHSSLIIKGSLTYSKIQEGMTILACVKHVTNFSLEVELPGLTFGHVNVINISDSFRSYLNKKLKDNDVESDKVLKQMFTIGQFVLTKVISIQNGEKLHIDCSLNPRHINNEKSHDSFKKGMLIWAAVQSVLDHGYEMNLGVKNCRVFLPSKNVDEGRKLRIGELIWCIIHKSESTSTVTTLRVSSKEQHIKATKIEEVNSLLDIIPGMQVEMVTDKITSYGIQGKFMNEYFGYIDETQLKYPLKSLDDYKEGKLLSALVLYVEPTTKITHLTLRNLEPVSPSYTNGDIISAEVKSKSHNGIYLKLPTKEKCFVTNKRLLNFLSKHKHLENNDSMSISAKFPPGSKHTCRILDYSHLLQMYICTMEQSVVTEKMFSVKDVELGQVVSVTIQLVKEDGLVATAGRIRGFIPNFHISNVQYSENLKKKFKVGHTVNARVFCITDNNIIFTLKSSLVDSDKCLTTLDKAKKGDQYPGIVINTKPAGALVLFYGDVKGWISYKHLDSEQSEKKLDASEFFYRGQVINTWVLGVKGSKVMLTLRAPLKSQQNIRIGQRISGTIGKIRKDRIDIKSPWGKTIGVLPVSHLSCTLSLCPIFLKTFKKGDHITDLLCIDNKSDPVILSRREAKALDRCKKLRLKKFENLKQGHLVRCSYVSSSETGIYVLPLILNYIENIFIEHKDIINKGEIMPTFYPHQSIIAKVRAIVEENENKTLRLTIKYKEVFDNSVETAVGFFSQHLADIKYLRSVGYANEWEICQYYPGERVPCKLEQLGDEGGCLVTLPNNVKGLVAPHLCPDKLKPGQSLEGVFLSQDFKDNYVEICLRSDISQRINEVQDGLLDKTSELSSCVIKNILVKNDSVLGVIRQDDGNRQFVYIPLFLHENDNQGCLSYYEKDKLKICICGKVGSYLIGMSKNLFLSLDKQKTRIIKLKSARKNNHAIEANNEDIDDSDENMEKSEESEEDIDDNIYSDSEEHDEDSEVENHDNISTTSSEDANILAVQRHKDGKKIEKNITFGEETIRNFTTTDPITGPLPILPGVSSFFKPNKEVQEEASSDEDGEVETIKKKKKLSPAERAEYARQEEERISRIERELADSTKAPESAEQFDRLLLANPNSSELWAQYMSFHIAATEFDKARTVAKRALDTIDMTLIEEKFNIWVALLNLENMFGTKDSFDKTFEEAVRYNDSLHIYLRVIGILAESGKFSNMEEKIKKVRNKHKQEPIMWIEVAKVYYSLNKFKEARNITEACLKSIEDKKTQVNLIVRFAIMEFKYGEEEQGAAVFETILNSDPRKVSIWITYVDQLIKKDRIEQARKVLERAVCQRLSLKSTKTLFIKFRTFEEQHGTPDSVEAVKDKAKEYVSNFADK